MTRNIPAMIVAAMAGVAVSMSGGYLLASYVVSGIAPVYRTPARVVRLKDEPPRFLDDNWPKYTYAAPTN